MSQINFYILSKNKPLIPFVCQLTQTALNKSDERILIITPSDMLHALDEKLWSFSETAFIAHDILLPEQTPAQTTNLASVLLTDNLARVAEFNGVVINLTLNPLLMFKGVKLLEIITEADESLMAGRQKYRAYQQQFCEFRIQHFRV